MMNALSSLFGSVLVTLYYQKVITFEDESMDMPKSLKVYWLLSNLSSVVSISLSCIYWPLIYNGRDKGLNDSLTHAGNAVFMLLDLFINAHPPRYGHFIYPLTFGAFYAFVFSLPYTLLGGTDRDLNNFIYSVLDWKSNTKGALTFAILTLVFLTIMHCVLSFLASMRVWIGGKIKTRLFVAHRGDLESNDRGIDNLSHNF